MGPSDHWKARELVPYHAGQFAAPYRSTVELGRFMQRLIPEPGGAALDVGCGAGANIYHLGQQFPEYRWTGIDLAGDLLFSIGRPHLDERGQTATLITGDFYKLRQQLGGQRFDLVLSIQTLSFLPGYEEALDELLAVTRGWLFITSLFSDDDVEARIQVTDYSQPANARGPHHYNIYNLARFQSFCATRGSRAFHVQDFEIDVDLPRQTRGLGTYTMSLDDGRRLQYTGPLLLPWKFLGVQMADSPSSPVD